MRRPREEKKRSHKKNREAIFLVAVPRAVGRTGDWPPILFLRFHLIDAPIGRIDQMPWFHLIDAPIGRIDQMVRRPAVGRKIKHGKGILYLTVKHNLCLILQSSITADSMTATATTIAS